ncbi:MAG: hypothetical protein Q4F79_02395 [Eubacteriales bacterium]|nr:hypothetical protein [Eubacteriales bacterium]
MKQIRIIDERTGARPLGDAEILSATFDGDHPDYLTLENGCRIFCDDRPNYHTEDGREFAEVQELEKTKDGLEGVIIGYTEIVV